MAGIIAPSKLPRCGVPVLCTPVSILDIREFILCKVTLFEKNNSSENAYFWASVHPWAFRKNNHFMKIIRKFLLLLYRIWFYILIVVPILALFPILLLSVSRERWYPFFFWLARFWARIILFGMGFAPKIKRLEKTEKGKSYMYVANHTSMTDIMLMLHVVKNPFVFVGKKELSRFPVFGYFYKKTCILVDRGDVHSRRAVFESAQHRLKQGLSICIFPEGGVPDDRRILLDSFKDGAFRLATEHDIPVVPMVFFDNKKRFSYDFFSGSPGLMRVKVLPFISPEGDSIEDRKSLRQQTRDAILKELKADHEK